MSDKLCPALCGRQCRRDYAMCKICWYKVPMNLRQNLYSAWDAWRADFGNTEYMKSYELALERCVEAVHAA
jgi:hypothetical protein